MAKAPLGVDNSVASRVGSSLCLDIPKYDIPGLRRRLKRLGITPRHLKKLHAAKNEVSRVLRRTYKHVPQEKADLVFKKFFKDLPKPGAKPKEML